MYVLSSMKYLLESIEAFRIVFEISLTIESLPKHSIGIIQADKMLLYHATQKIWNAHMVAPIKYSINKKVGQISSSHALCVRIVWKDK